MVVRGAPAIGITAAYAVVLSARRLQADGQKIGLATLEETFHGLANTRPRSQFVLGSHLDEKCSRCV